MSNLSRDLIKWVRDKAKSKYKKDSKCFICGSSEALDFHHFYSMTEMLKIWLRKNKFSPTTDDEIISLRDEFIESHTLEIYEKTVTLCHEHHLKLHSIYGKNPALATAEKQARWVVKQRDKYGMVES